MEATPLPTADADNWAEQFDRSLGAQRERVEEFLAAGRQRLQRAEAELAKQFQQVAEELAENRQQTRLAREEIEQRSEQLARESASVQQLLDELAARKGEWEQLQQRAAQHQEALTEETRRQQDELDRRRDELAKLRAQVDQSQAAVHHDQQALNLASQEQQAQREQLRAWQEALAARQGELDQQHAELQARQTDTRTQRRRIAQELKAQHAAQLKDLMRRRAELEQHDAGQQAELAGQLQSARKEAAGLAAELESLRGKCQKLEQELAQQPVANGPDPQEVSAALAERDTLRQQLAATESRLAGVQSRLAETEGRLTETEPRLADAERRLAEAQSRLAEAANGDAETQKAENDFQRRYELALEDVRELKARNAELQQRLEKASAEKAQQSAAGAVLDWEAEKRRILSALETDFDHQDGGAAEQRLTIEGVMQTTDEVLAEKDRQIGELKQLLESQTASVGSVAVGAAALGDVLDKDAIIQEEREGLKRLQQEWRERLRQAEIDLSLERAEIARRRAEIEEKLRTLEKQRADAGVDQEDKAESALPARGRWLTRLGLRDPEKQQ